ncbi:translation initiation factor IF-2 subunit gamma [Candidatus Woesearchaeota archaeon]|nr:translation initiation factor IF-2 subunit gamma [Candidatus Woesearchaeota archaeon]
MVKKKQHTDVENSQPEVNIGLVGHVDHGKTTLTERLSGKWTDTHSEEIKRGITIRLGYADSVFRKCPDTDDAEGYTTAAKCPHCGKDSVAVRKVSFVDAPGHESLMATMLAGTTIMDGALLVIAANERCPQPQTQEHLMALDIVGVENVVVVQNKIDLVSRDDAVRNFKQIKAFLKGTRYENVPIVPITAQHNINIGFLIKAIEDTVKTPNRDSKKDPLMLVARSFDINRPGTAIEGLKGGVLGGTLKEGMLTIGDEIEIRPGRMVEEKNQKVWKPIKTTIMSIVTGGKEAKEISPGGSMGVLTSLDPSIVKSDKLTGNVVGKVGKLPEVWYEFNLGVNLLERVVGSEKELNVEPIKMGEVLMLNVNSAATVGIVDKLGKNQIHCKLKLPVCAEKSSRITISRRIGTRFRLIGFGTILK